MIDSHIHKKYSELGKYTFMHIATYMVRSGMVTGQTAAIDLINEDKHDLFELVNIMKNPPQPEVSTSEEEQQDE
jgi:hypothetical protein|tara:strand:- start:67 stop:288 length:222 start_codon:yes stop_codon:yes gene_type:complete